MASKPIIGSYGATYRSPRTSTNSPHSQRTKTKTNHQLIYISPRQPPKLDKISDNSFMLIANKQNLFKEIRNACAQNGISEEFRQKLDTCDYKYSKETHRNFKSINESIKKAANSLNVSPVTKSRKRTIENPTINNCNVCFNDLTSRTIRLKEGIYKPVPQIKTLTPRTIHPKTNLSLVSERAKHGVQEEITNLLKIRRPKKLISPRLHKRMNFDVNEDVEPPNKSSQPDRFKSKRQPPENICQLPKLRLPVSLNTSIDGSTEPSVKFELLYSYFKSPATRK